MANIVKCFEEFQTNFDVFDSYVDKICRNLDWFIGNGERDAEKKIRYGRLLSNIL